MSSSSSVSGLRSAALNARVASRLVQFAAHATTSLAYVESTLRLRGELSDSFRESERQRIPAWALHILGVRTAATGEAPTTAGRGRLIVANHRTALDIGVLMTTVGGSFLSRSDLAEWPIAGTLAKHADTVFVDRESRNSGAAAIRTIRTRLKRGGSIIVFPEGTTHRGDEVQEFKAGTFIAARGLGAEIVPVGLAYPEGCEYVGISFMDHIKIVAARRTTPVAVRIGSPFIAEGKTKDVAARAQEEVQRLTDLARADFARLP